MDIIFDFLEPLLVRYSNDKIGFSSILTSIILVLGLSLINKNSLFIVDVSILNLLIKILFVEPSFYTHDIIWSEKYFDIIGILERLYLLLMSISSTE